MKRNITLKRSISVSCWRVVGQIAKASKRAELLPLLRRAQEQGGTDPRDVAEHLFFEARSRKVVAERLLHIAAAYRLLEKGPRGWWTLTDEGRAALQSEQVFVPEDGAWTLWASNDPLLGSRVLRVEPWQEPSAYDEVWGKEKNAGRPFERLPHWLMEIVGLVQQPCAGEGKRLRIDALESKGERVQPAARLTLHWTLQPGRLQVRGAVGDAQVQTELAPPNLSPADVWAQLLKRQGLWDQWRPAKDALVTAFDEANEVERESMVRTVRFDEPQIEGCGSFDPLSVSGIALSAASQEDAERWARWRLDARIQDYATAERMTAWSQAAVEPFPEHRVALPDRRGLAREALRKREQRPSPRTWHLVAAEDWSL